VRSNSDMADDNNDPTRWSHSSGEYGGYQGHVEQATTYPIEQADWGIRGTRSELEQLNSSGRDAQDRRNAGTGNKVKKSAGKEKKEKVAAEKGGKGEPEGQKGQEGQEGQERGAEVRQDTMLAGFIRGYLLV